MRRCEYIERKTPSKNILEFLKHLSSRSHHKFFLDHPVCICSMSIGQLQCIKWVWEVRTQNLELSSITSLFLYSTSRETTHASVSGVASMRAKTASAPILQPRVDKGQLLVLLSHLEIVNEVKSKF